MPHTPTPDEVFTLTAQGGRTRGQMELHVRRTWDISYTRFQQLLNRYLQDPEAETTHPTEVRRLRRIRDDRIAHRNARRLRVRP